MVPGDRRPAYPHGAQARQILNDAEDDLRDWRPEADPYGTPESGSPTNSFRGKNLAIDEADELDIAPVNGNAGEHTMTTAVGASEAYRDDESVRGI